MFPLPYERHNFCTRCGAALKERLEGRTYDAETGEVALSTTVKSCPYWERGSEHNRLTKIDVKNRSKKR
jgi:hypothetical protein